MGFRCRRRRLIRRRCRRRRGRPEGKGEDETSSIQVLRLERSGRKFTDLKDVESSSHVSLGELEQSSETGRVEVDSGDARKNERRRGSACSSSFEETRLEDRGK